MGNRKDIGKAFREKLKDFDQSPDSKVWDAIRSDLQDKRKRRILPFWFTFTALSVLLLGGIVGITQFGDHDNNQQNPSKVNRSGSEAKKIEDDNHGSFIGGTAEHGESEDHKVNEAVFGPAAKGGENPKFDTSTNNRLDAIEAKKRHPNVENFKTRQSSITSHAGTGKKISEKISTDTSLANAKPITSGQNETPRQAIKNRGTSLKKDKDQNALSATQPSTTLNPVAHNPVDENKGPEETDTDAIAASQPVDGKAKQIIDLSDEKTDSIPTTAKPTENAKPTEEPNKVKNMAQDVLEKAKREAQKLSLFVYGSPTYVGFTSDVSPLDRRLNANSLTSEVGLSYGAYAIYEATDRWSLRFGIGIVNQKTVTSNATVNTLNYTGIDYNKNDNVMIYAQSGATTMDLTQEISYIEVPLEIKYALLKGKFGINPFGGLGLRFLGKNEITAKTANAMHFEVGQTKHLSSNTFTINAGIGFEYKFAKRLRLNIEPVFKYHLNDYKNVAVRPYSFGVLTGLQFSIKE